MDNDSFSFNIFISSNTKIPQYMERSVVKKEVSLSLFTILCKFLDYFHRISRISCMLMSDLCKRSNMSSQRGSNLGDTSRSFKVSAAPRL